jgi:hypothetical protein
MFQLATATWVPSRRHDRIRREAHRTSRSNKIHTPPLQWLTKRLKRVAAEFTDLIEQEETAMCPRQLARRHAWTPANESRHRDVVMRCP